MIVTVNGVFYEVVDSFADADYVPEVIEPLPDLPAEVWNTRPVDAVRCMDAVRAMCGGR